MMTHLIQSALILTTFYTAYRILFERFTFFQHNRIFLLSGLGLSLALPFLPLNFSKERMEYVYLPKTYFENMPADVSAEMTSKVVWHEWTFSEWLLLVYFTGVALFTVVMIFQVIQISLLISKGKLIRKDGMKLVLTEKTTSPFSFFNTIVMNPKMLSEEQLGHIVTHENIHISQWHQLDVVMAEILKIVLWFFPVSWWYGKSIRTNLEFIADTNSLENGLDKKAYQLNLVSISQQPSGSVLVNNFSKKLIKHRIKMLNKMKTKRQILSFYAVLIPALVLVSIGISVQAQSQNEKVKQVIVLSEDKVNPDDVKVQVKNEAGEFEDLDSANIFTIPGDGREIIIVKTDEDRIKISQSGKPGKLSWEQIDGINSNEIASVNVDKADDKSTIIIRYRDGRKNDTIFRASPGVQGYGHTFGDFDKILSPKELKLKIQNGDIDLGDPKNEWLKKWKENNFKEPFEYNYNGNFELNKDEIFKIFKMDSLTLKKIAYLPNGYSIVTPEKFRDFKMENFEYIPNRNTVYSKIPLDNILKGKKPLVLIDGEVSTMKKIRKLENDDDYEIFYIQSDAMVAKYGKKAKDGTLMAKKKNKPSWKSGIHSVEKIK